VYDGTIVTNPSANAITRSCDIRGSRTIHNYVQFRTGVDGGPHYIHVIPNNDEVSGTYTLRILPDHTHGAAAWDEDTAEPNNSAANAYELQPGLANAREFRIAQPDPAFSFSNDVDRDWYRFETVPERIYVIELVNVSGNLGERGFNCASNSDGVGLEVYDGTIVTNSSANTITRSCDIRGSSTIHNYVQFRAGVDGGTYYIGVIPNADEITGDYTLRILPEHTDPAADWDDTTAEPNNRPANAFLLETGNLYTFQAEARNPEFSTSARADFDWYRLNTDLNEEYTIELTDVSAALNERGFNCRSNADGVGLIVYDPSILSNSSADPVVNGCDAFLEGDVHNRVTFNSALNTTFYIGVIPNADNVSGSYTIQITR
jgi:hypothetical protein